MLRKLILGQRQWANEPSVNLPGAVSTVIVGQFIPRSFLLSGGVELTRHDLQLTHAQLV